MSIEKAKAHLSRWNRDADVQEHALSSATVELAAKALGTEPCRIAKTLSFLNGDRTILLVLGNTRKSLARATGAGAGDRMEQAGEVFHSRVNRAFLKLAKRDPKRIRIVRSSSSRKATAAAVAAELADILPELSARAEGATPSQPAAPHGEGAAKGKPQAKRKRGGRGKRGNRG